MWSKPTNKYLKIELTNELNRTAIDSSGRLGSLYDGYRDVVLKPLNVHSQKRTHRMLKETRCFITESVNTQNQNILKIISIEEELRLSILLNLTKKFGIAKSIDYYYSINEYTRFFLYTHLDRQEQFSDNPYQIEIFDQSPIYVTDATHMITKIVFGIDAVVILQLPSNPSTAMQIDDILRKLRSFLLYKTNVNGLTADEEHLLGKMTRTTVYSNVPDMGGMTRILDVCRYIEQIKNSIIYHTISYTLQPITWLYPQYTEKGATFIHLPIELSENIEQYIVQVRNDIHNLETLIDKEIPKLSSGYFEEQLSSLEQQWSSVNKKYSDEIKRLSYLVNSVRCGHIHPKMINQTLNNYEQTMMKNFIRDLMQNLTDLKDERYFVSNLNPPRLYYSNSAEHVNDVHGNKRRIFRLVTNDKHDQGLYSNNVQTKTKSKQLNQVRSHLPEEHYKNATQRLNNVDSYHQPLKLYDNQRSPPRNEYHGEVKHRISPLPPTQLFQTSASRSVKTPISISPFPHEYTIGSLSPRLSEAVDETINILLLGETGVGKSTFINAFANYLSFNTLEQAEVGAPVILIPVSFLITVGDNFEEHMVKFGDIHALNNEDFNHPGQSVTQNCQKHSFHLNIFGGKKLCIIDTPGFGDTRGLDQDDRNMQHILAYISNLSHLNAVCVLLKPNESRLNIFFRSCLAQLFSLLGPTIANNIIFCFTNSRSTFYTPGNTAPLIKKMLVTLSMGNVPFKKDNTFCFDSESFRYLVAQQKNILFSDDDKLEYGMSWSMSVTEANRLIHYIHNHLAAYRILTRM